MGNIAVHEEILGLLPWYINESLGEKERGLVMTHLRECPDCRKERDQLQSLQALVKESDRVPDYQFSYNKLLSRIEEAERNRESTAELDEGSPPRKQILFAGMAASLVFALVIVGSGISGLLPKKR